MTFDIVDLKHVTDDTEKYGGKAVALSKLLANGLNVPNGFVLPTNIYLDYTNGLIDYNELINELDYWLTLTGLNNEFIVRSSANIESVAGIDCPGVFDSFICHGKQNVLNTVRRVWESANAAETQAYLSHFECAPKVKMAVIIQCIQKGTYTAVIQSYDLIEDKRRIVVEYCEGAINSIVDDELEASICFIDYDSELVCSNSPLPLELIRKDCIAIETIVGGHAEIEAQIIEDKIWYIQARTIN